MSKIPPHHACPECGSDSTKQHQDYFGDWIQDVRTCDECPTEWAVWWDNPTVEEVMRYDTR